MNTLPQVTEGLSLRPALASLADASPKSILIFHGTTGFRHNSIDEGIDLINELGQKNGWTVAETEDFNDLNATNLAQYDAVIALNSIGTTDNAAQVTALIDYVQAGGGLVSVHGGLLTFGDSDRFEALLGAEADVSNNRQNLHSPNNTAIEIEVSDHPATEGLPALFNFADELYNYTARPSGEYLLTVDTATYNGGNGISGDDYPLAWVRTEGQGRVFSSTLGHDEHLYEGMDQMDLFFQQHLEQGIEWVLGESSVPTGVAIRINAGGPAYTDSSGKVWSADQYFVGGNLASTQANIANTSDDALYQTERWLRDLAYEIPVDQNGEYEVTLKLVEFWANDSGVRVFDAFAEGQQLLDDFDILAEAGGKYRAIDKTFDVTVNDGVLNLDFLASANNAKLSAIEVVAKDGTTDPEPTQSAIRINAGGGSYVDVNGDLWSADQYFEGGNLASTQANIADTEDDTLYKTERWLRDLSYSIPVSQDGEYEVTLKLAEFWANDLGVRVFDAFAEGQQLLDDFDILAEAGGKYRAIDRTFDVTVNDGVLNLDFLASANNAKLSAIEIIPKSLIDPEPEPEPEPEPTPEWSALINFQSAGAPTPQGYLADVGAAFSEVRGYGWITEASLGGTAVPVDIQNVARDRNDPGTDQRLDTFLHMDHINGDAPAAAWEYVLPNGRYSVTVSVGDRYFDSTHRINIEGQNVLPNFVPNSTHAFELATADVTVTDGKLTIDSLGGDNTRLNYVEIESITPGEHPRIPGGVPVSRAGNINRDDAITLDVDLLGSGNVVEPSSITSDTVQLYRTKDGAPVSGIANTTGGGDAIVFQPSQTLDPNTHYTFRISSELTDEAGIPFLPFSTTFTTGSNDSSNAEIQFNKSTAYAHNGPLGFTSLEVSPDGTELYGATLDAEIHRWQIEADGSLSNQQVFTGLSDQNRSIIGLVFDPDDANTLWVTNNHTSLTSNAPDFSSRVSKVRLQGGSDFNPTVEDYIVGLPRASRSHMSNSLEFGPDGALYLIQGGNAATGAPDSNWGNRPERLLTASVLRIDPDRTAPAGGFDVQTENYNGTTGNYDPTAPGAPVTLFGKGIRNAYDLVWHSNGSLYVPNNGNGAAEGNTPDDPDTLVNEALLGVNTQNDYLYRVEQGGYYGHPNPTQGHYILNGGNPTAGVDVAEVTQYPVGTQPDPLYQGFAYDFGRNRSPNGVIEYQGDTFGGKLQNQLLVVEYSAGDDILALELGANGEVIGSSAIAGGFNNPLDLVEHAPTGNLYVSEFGSQQISLLTVA